MATQVKTRKSAETPSERFERVVRMAKARGQRARARRMERASAVAAASTRRSPEATA